MGISCKIQRPVCFFGESFAAKPSPSPAVQQLPHRLCQGNPRCAHCTIHSIHIYLHTYLGVHLSCGILRDAPAAKGMNRQGTGKHCDGALPPAGELRRRKIEHSKNCVGKGIPLDISESPGSLDSVQYHRKIEVVQEGLPLAALFYWRSL